MLELFQTEWCPESRRIRQRLTELGLDYVNRQVPVERVDRAALYAATGSDTIPALVLEDGSALIGEHEILAYLAPDHGESEQAVAHREKAAKAERRYLEEQCAPSTGYTLEGTTPLSYAEAVERVRAELASEGFGVLCEIDVQATMREKLSVEVEPYLILGACNPPLAHQALEAEPGVGVLLPCNVVVYRGGGETHISAVDPERMLSIVGHRELAPIAAQVKSRLRAVVDRVATI